MKVPPDKKLQEFSNTLNEPSACCAKNVCGLSPQQYNPATFRIVQVEAVTWLYATLIDCVLVVVITSGIFSNNQGMVRYCLKYKRPSLH